MIDGTYAVQIDTPLGKKSGTVTLTASGSRVIAQINAPIIGKQRIEGTARGSDDFSARGSMRIPLMGKIDYTAEGQVAGDVLTCDISTAKGKMTVRGTRQ